MYYMMHKSASNTTSLDLKLQVVALAVALTEQVVSLWMTSSLCSVMYLADMEEDLVALAVLAVEANVRNHNIVVLTCV